VEASAGSCCHHLWVVNCTGLIQENKGGHKAGKIMKTDSAQSSSNKCKNYLLKIYLQHIDFLNTI